MDLHIPVLRHLEGVVPFRYLPIATPLPPLLKSMTTAAVETISCTEMVENAYPPRCNVHHRRSP